MAAAAVAAAATATATAAGDDGKNEWDNLNARLMCPDCREFPPNLVEEFSSGDMVCGSCGLVLGDRIIDTRSEWRTFANDDQNNDDPSRVGEAANPLLDGSQLGTTIGRGEGKQAVILQRANNRSQQEKASKVLLSAFKDIGHLCDAINIPRTVQDSAKVIYKMIDEAKLFKGKSQESVIAGCIFIACRQQKVPRTFREIYSLTKVAKKEIGRTFKQIEKFLQSNPKHTANSNIVQQFDNVPATNSTSATELCGRYCNQLNFGNPHKMEKISKILAERSSGVSELAGRSPLSVAAACIYMTSYLMGEGRTSKKIADVAGVSDGTIKTAYKYLYNAREQVVDAEWLTPKFGGRMDRLPIN